MIAGITVVAECRRRPFTLPSGYKGEGAYIYSDETYERKYQEAEKQLTEAGFFLKMANNSPLVNGVYFWEVRLNTEDDADHEVVAKIMQVHKILRGIFRYLRW